MAKKPKEREIIRNKTTNYFEVYSNHADFRITFVDFQFNFGRITAVSPEKLEVEQLVGVVMSPQQTKDFLRVLTLNVERYEKQNGVIPSPPRQRLPQ